MSKRTVKRPPEAWNMEEHRKILDRYNDKNEVYVDGKYVDCGEQPWVTVTEIVVPTERDKQQILQALKYLHDNRTIDTDFLAVNSLVHLYECPNRIKVKEAENGQD